MFLDKIDETADSDFSSGSFRLLANSVKTNSQILISCKNKRKIIGRIKAFDRHMNIFMENVREIWNEPSEDDSKNKCFLWFLKMKVNINKPKYSLVLNFEFRILNLEF